MVTLSYQACTWLLGRRDVVWLSLSWFFYLRPVVALLRPLRVPTCPLAARGGRLAFSSRLFLVPSDDRSPYQPL